MSYNFCVFILTHGRPDRVVTLRTLIEAGYTGDWKLIVDNEDEAQSQYIERFGADRVIIFDKRKVEFDPMDLSEDRRTVVYARNECFKIAKQLGYDYFLELDDDYSRFEYRFIKHGELKSKKIKNIGKLFEAMLDFLEQSQSITVAMAQGGDFIGGKESPNAKAGLTRKAMNSFFCKTEKSFIFPGRINEDVNFYTHYGSRGYKIFTFTGASLVQTETQTISGGMTETYLEAGTYVKSFYSVMISPSCVRIRPMGDTHLRLHHQINWDCCVPKILNERHKKRKTA